MAKQPKQFKSAFGIYLGEAIIGEGGSGRVYRATDTEGKKVAVKVLDPKKATKEKRKRFKNEILFGSQNSHKGIVRVLDFGFIDDGGSDALFCVMPLYRCTLRAKMKEGVRADEVLRLFGTLLDCMEAAHLKGVVHRDLKPENIFLDDADRSLVVGDFGIAHFAEDELFTLIETMPGTRLANFLYAAPEQKVRGREVGVPADIYALGLLLNELFTGEVPQGTGYPLVKSVEPNFSYLDDLVAEMIRQNPVERLRSIDEVKKRLIANENEFIHRQKLNKLEGTVVPDAEVDDPLVTDPIKIAALDVQSEWIDLMLNRDPNREWIDIFRSAPGVTYCRGSLDFRQFPIQRRAIRIPGPNPPFEHMGQQLIDQVKAGIVKTNAMYAEQAERDARDRVAAERRRLQAEAEARRKKLELQKQLKI